MINFFNEFLFAEYSNNRARYDIEISDAAFLEYETKVKSFFHSYVQSSLGYNRVNEFEDEESINISKIKLERQRKRILYMVRVYKEYELGANLRSKVKSGADLYRFFVSSDSVLQGEELTYISDSFFAAETDEGFKLIYRSAFRKSKWNHSTHPDEQVQKLGKAVETIRLEEPISLPSKEVYFSDEDFPFDPNS